MYVLIKCRFHQWAHKIDCTKQYAAKYTRFCGRNDGENLERSVIQIVIVAYYSFISIELGANFQVSLDLQVK